MTPTMVPLVITTAAAVFSVAVAAKAHHLLRQTRMQFAEATRLREEAMARSQVNSDPPAPHEAS